MINQRRQNNAFVGAPPAYDTREDEFAAFDALPPMLRAALNQNAVKLSSRTVAHHLAWVMRVGRGPSATVAKVAELERFEIEVFAGRYLSETKLSLPHVTAGATVQRYGKLGPSLFPPRRYGKPSLRPRRKRRPCMIDGMH